MTNDEASDPDKLTSLLDGESLRALPTRHQEHDEASEHVGEVLPIADHFARGPNRKLDLRHDDDLLDALNSRVWAISHAIRETIARHDQAILQGIQQLERWIRNREVVRVIGAGRALHAASIPANRLVHTGADVYVINDVVPLPNSNKDGGIIASSASGQTKAVLEMMEDAKTKNPQIVILGVADANANAFESLCDIFVGVEDDSGPYDNPLHALADTGEYVISELLDAMIVAAGKRLGLTDEDFRGNHEDIGPTGPYQPLSSNI
jgi:D-arabinose 5-phosphate isomerase GutQ